jgi:regulator of sirC expression with transglutaminase-like and TPR domain
MLIEEEYMKATEALKINPTDSNSLFYRGTLYFSLNKNEQGAKDFELLIKTAPEKNQFRLLAIKRLEN